MARVNNRHAKRHAAKPNPDAPRCAVVRKDGTRCTQQAVAWFVHDETTVGYCEAHAMQVVTGRLR